MTEGAERILVIVNAARGFWQKGEYGMWVGGGTAFEQIYSSQVRRGAGRGRGGGRAGRAGEGERGFFACWLPGCKHGVRLLRRPCVYWYCR